MEICSHQRETYKVKDYQFIRKTLSDKTLLLETIFNGKDTYVPLSVSSTVLHFLFQSQMPTEHKHYETECKHFHLLVLLDLFYRFVPERKIVHVEGSV